MYLFFLKTTYQTFKINGYIKYRYLGSFNFIERIMNVANTINEIKAPKKANNIDFLMFLFIMNRNIIPSINKTPLEIPAGFKTNSCIRFNILFSIYYKSKSSTVSVIFSPGKVKGNFTCGKSALGIVPSVPYTCI